MDETLSWIFAIGITFLTIRYFFSSPTAPSTRPPRPIPQQQLDSLTSMFPHLSVGAIRWELERNGGSSQVLAERVLRDGVLPEPPASFFLPPASSSTATPAPTTANRAQPPSTAASSATPNGQPVSLIKRLGLSSAATVPVGDDMLDVKGKGKAKEEPSSREKVVWETTAEARERSLRERKEKMVLNARRKLLEKQNGQKA